MNTERETNILAKAFATGVITDEAREIARIRAEETRETLIAIGSVMSQSTLEVARSTPAHRRGHHVQRWTKYFEKVTSPDYRDEPGMPGCTPWERARCYAHGIALLKLLALADGQILA